ncbi:RHS repeat-associated core domain protein containing protein [Pseudomonas savastanoi pv. glycinea]|uniref:RHS repeat-associated core domain-containing protein n=1 Tax=Pseudomonas quasicaspiana TaxID=2829821 RepID=UPI000F3FCD5D|nr:RHS repeat-associated core domain-containing protein [Pseudomonas quasicaspiana]RMR00556.1 RHS repeat-associated core domain protein containing protein [Pseudomonas savastanoi pv. glycinea]
MNKLISYRYDALDRLIGVEPAGASASTRVYRDGRIATQLEGGQRHSLMESGGHVLAQSTYSGNRVVNSLLGCDQQGSVLQSVTGNQIQRSVYTPYGGGANEGGLQSLLGFNGEQPDPVTGCYLLGNGYRAYNPVLMRFHSPDTMSPFDSGGVNPYAYCVGDPVNMTDPTGHFSWKSILSILISVAAIAITAITLGAGTPLTGPLIFASVIGIAGEVLSIASELVGELAPDSRAGAILGQLSLGLSLASLTSPSAAKVASSRGARAASRFFNAGPVSVARQGAIRVSNGQALKSLGGVAKLGKGARNTVSIQNRLIDAEKVLKGAKYLGYAAKGASYADQYVIPYFNAPATGQSEEAPSTLDAFVRGDTDEGAQGLGQINIKPGDFLTVDQDRMQALREF